MSKVCVIGLDGATFTVIDYLVEQERLPNFASLMDEGSRATLQSTIPPLTPAAWSSFFIGANPGKTGAVGFFRFCPGTYQLEPMNACNLQGTPLWSLVSSRDKRVCVYNVPVTYPAIPVNGILISGMDAPRFDDQAIFPLEEKGKLLAVVPDFTVSFDYDPKYLVNHHQDPVGEWIQQAKKYLQMEINTTNYLMQREDWDLFVAVIRSSDIFQHTMWADAEKVMDGDEVSDEERRRAEAVFSCYESIDKELGDSWSKWCSDRDLVIMSDHGFGKLRSDVCLNRVLADAGLLKFQPRENRQRRGSYLVDKLKSHLPPRTRKRIKRFLGRDDSGERWHRFVDTLVADIDWSQTRIASIAQHGCLYVNLVGRDPLGTVGSEEERQEVLSEAEAALSRLTDPEDGEPLVTEFYRGDQIYHGPLMAVMPDMVINMRDWSYTGIYSTEEELSEEAIIRPKPKEWKQLAHTGAHRREGILILHGPHISHVELEPVQMVDIAPTILRLLELPVPDDWEGRVIAQALAAGVMDEIRGDYQPSGDGAGEKTYSDEDEEEIRKRLENLGYL